MNRESLWSSFPNSPCQGSFGLYKSTRNTKNWGSTRWGYTYLDREQPVLRPQGRRTTQSFPKKNTVPMISKLRFEKSISEITYPKSHSYKHEVSFIANHFFQKMIIHDPRWRCKDHLKRIPGFWTITNVFSSPPQKRMEEDDVPPAKKWRFSGIWCLCLYDVFSFLSS